MPDTIPISHANLLDSAAYVPLVDRTKFLATLLVGTQGLAAIMGEVTPPAAIDQDAPRSFPLTVSQARALKTKLDAATWAVIKEAVSNVENNVGRVDWMKVKELTGVADWTAFAKGRLGGLHRALRGIGGVTAVAPKATLFWWDNDDDWVEDDQGDYSEGTLRIDGPALTVLRSVIGVAAD